MHDPLRVVYDALEAGGWQPHGPEHDFRANCPGHGGDSGQLHVNEGEDGRAVLFCHTRGCGTKEIIDALGLRWGDLFPDGHQRAPRSRRARIETEHPLEALLTALGIAGIPYRCTTDPRFFVAESCPSCGARGLWLFRRDERVALSCAKGCPAEAVQTALKVAIS